MIIGITLTIQVILMLFQEEAVQAMIISGMRTSKYFYSQKKWEKQLANELRQAFNWKCLW